MLEIRGRGSNSNESAKSNVERCSAGMHAICNVWMVLCSDICIVVVVVVVVIARWVAGAVLWDLHLNFGDICTYILSESVLEAAVVLIVRIVGAGTRVEAVVEVSAVDTVVDGIVDSHNTTDISVRTCIFTSWCCLRISSRHVEQDWYISATGREAEMLRVQGR